MSELQADEMSVLIVDDEAHLRNLLVSVVRKMGWAAAAVRSAEEAARAMAVDARRVILLDLNLPGMQGMEFLELVRQRWPGTVVVILTGFGDLTAAKRAIRLDVVDFVSKPFDLGEIEIALDRARRRLFPERSSRADSKAEPAAIPPGNSAATIEAMERDLILASLTRHNGNRSAAAAELGISRRTLYNKLMLFELQGELPTKEPK